MILTGETMVSLRNPSSDVATIMSFKFLRCLDFKVFDFQGHSRFSVNSTSADICIQDMKDQSRFSPLSKCLCCGKLGNPFCQSALYQVPKLKSFLEAPSESSHRSRNYS